MSMQNQRQAHLLLPARLSARFRGPTLPAHRLSFFSTANVRNVSQYCLHNYYISIKGPFFVSVRPVIIVNEVVHKVNINEIKICAMLRFDLANTRTSYRSSRSSEMIRLFRENNFGNMHKYTDHTVSETRERWGARGQRRKIVYWREPNWIKVVTKWFTIKTTHSNWTTAAWKWKLFWCCVENKEYHLAAAITFSKLKVYWAHLYRYSKLYTWKFKINYFKIILFILTADWFFSTTKLTKIKV